MVESALKRGPLFTRIVVQTFAWLIVQGAILFLAAGDWRWPQGIAGYDDYAQRVRFRPVPGLW